MKVAYLRVSTDEQNLDLQERAIEGLQIDHTYFDLDSGVNCSRKGYMELSRDILKGSVDELIVYRLDRLGRDPIELIRFFNLLEDHEVKFVSITEPWLTDWSKGPMQFLTWWLQLGMAQFELLLLKDRQRRGIDAAKAAGKHLGRPRKK